VYMKYKKTLNKEVNFRKSTDTVGVITIVITEMHYKFHESQKH
jgi:ADP-ribosylglycohydrolase